MLVIIEWQYRLQWLSKRELTACCKFRASLLATELQMFFMEALATDNDESRIISTISKDVESVCQSKSVFLSLQISGYET